MALKREQIEDLIFGPGYQRRYTQDSPVLPDVWIEYCKDLAKPVDLLLAPRRDSSPAALHAALGARLRPKGKGKGQTSWRLTYNESYVAATLSFVELIRVALPLTRWWREHAWGGSKLPPQARRAGASRSKKNLLTLERLGSSRVRKELAMVLEKPGTVSSRLEVSTDLLWMIQLVGRIEWERKATEEAPTVAQLVQVFHELVKGIEEWKGDPPLWSISCNRPALPAVWRSVQAMKADAATRLFQLSCKELAWAVVDSGVDASHPAFRRRDSSGKLLDLDKDGSPGERSRIVRSYDFTVLRDYLDLAMNPGSGAKREGVASRGRARLDPAHVAELKRSLRSGRSIDWETLEPILRVPHDRNYHAPEHEHGTHVAGILAADWRRTDAEMPDDHDIKGMCPDIELYDLRVLNEEGVGDEFGILAALQFIRHLNANKDEPVIHGANISIAIRHDVANYACGRTPVCEECERLVASGVVVVAAAGNEGYTQFLTSRGPSDGYRSISITDPGNADGVITVGATHRYKPHTYGVSYFSSRGPTGDGRSKPDVVAPGEKIKAPVPDGKLKSLDGTSMAAPHVSGAAALLLARHGELMGQPARIKQILCETSTDLGRERFFQGSGMVDVLRALQSV